MTTLSTDPSQDINWLVQSYEPQQPTEQEKLAQLWRNGRLQVHLESLERFYQTKRAELNELIAARSPNASLVQVAKQLVVEAGIVDRMSETLDQISAIEEEIWIQGERGNFDRDSIAIDWTDRHAAEWRRWRIKEYCYATEQMEERLPDFLQDHR